MGGAGGGSCAREGGCVGLISSGRSGAPSSFIDASADGSDAFFLTEASLVPRRPGLVRPLRRPRRRRLPRPAQRDRLRGRRLPGPARSARRPDAGNAGAAMPATRRCTSRSRDRESTAAIGGAVIGARAQAAQPSARGPWMMRRLALGAGLVLALLGACAPPALADFGFQPGAAGFSFAPLAEGGTPERHAGSHPLELSTEVNFNLSPEPGVPVSEGDVKRPRPRTAAGADRKPDRRPALHAGRLPHPARTTPFEDTASRGRAVRTTPRSARSTVRSSFGGGTTRSFGLFNLDPPPGAPSELGFNPYGAPIVFVPADAPGRRRIRPHPAVSRNIPQLVDIYGSDAERLGRSLGDRPQRPARQLPERGRTRTSAGPNARSAPPQTQPAARLPDPAHLLRGALRFSVSAGLLAGTRRRCHRRNGSRRRLEGCDSNSASNRTPSASADRPPRLLAHAASTSTSKSTPAASSTPTGGRPRRCAKAVVSLPEGMTINPSVGAGPRRLHPAQYAAETASSPPGAGCPNDSKIGDFTVQEPAVRRHRSKARSSSPQPYREPLRLADRRLPGRQGARTRHPGQGRAASSTPTRRPGRLTAHLRQAAPAPLLAPQHPLPRRPARPAGHAGGLRRLLHAACDLTAWRDAEARAGTSQLATSRSPPGSAAGPAPRACPPFAPAADGRHAQLAAPAPTRPSTCT